MNFLCVLLLTVCALLPVPCKAIAFNMLDSLNANYDSVSEHLVVCYGNWGLDYALTAPFCVEEGGGARATFRISEPLRYTYYGSTWHGIWGFYDYGRSDCDMTFEGPGVYVICTDSVTSEGTLSPGQYSVYGGGDIYAYGNDYGYEDLYFYGSAGCQFQLELRSVPDDASVAILLGAGIGALLALKRLRLATALAEPCTRR